MLTVELTNLSLADRLQAMEVLWDSLSRDPQHDPSPAWHAEVLAQRRGQMNQEQLASWSEARARLQKTGSSGD